jgi:hypothetical protein
LEEYSVVIDAHDTAQVKGIPGPLEMAVFVPLEP